jgi:CheY-like chemotaxis protein
VTPATSPCVLIVEDNSSIRELCSTLLREAGYRVETAVDGRDGFDRLGCAPDLILLDVMMPVMDGREFLGRLRGLADHRRTPVLVMTAGRDCTGLAGAQAVMKKPFESETLFRRVGELLAAG